MVPTEHAWLAVYTAKCLCTVIDMVVSVRYRASNSDRGFMRLSRTSSCVQYR
jgi:hypothetical protein